MYKTKTFA